MVVNNIKSGFVLAGFETLSSIIDRFMKNEKGRFEDNFSRDDISKFLSSTCSGFLHSFGQNFTGRKSYKKYVANEAQLYKKCRDTGLFNDCTFITDSGGFQASVGKIDKGETETLITLYHEFLEEHSNVYDRAFILDLPPGPGCKIFESMDDVYKYNLKTYNIAKNMPDHIREKIIYIHHFRTPKLWDAFTRILRDEKMFDSFNYFATGGIVANMSTDMSIPCIIYVIPMIPLINEALKFKRKELNFHILGGANFRDILFYECFKKHVLEKHGLELKITFDSSGIFKGLMVGRFIHVRTKDIVTKMDLRSATLDLRFEGKLKIIDKYRKSVESFYKNHNFKAIDLSTIYCENSGTFHPEVTVYSMLYVLNLYSEVQTILKEKVNEIYPYYQSGDIEEFNKRVELVTRNLNGGKRTRKQKAKSASISKSLDMLTNLDENYCLHLVTKFLSKDEFSDQRVLTW